MMAKFMQEWYRTEVMRNLLSLVNALSARPLKKSSKHRGKVCRVVGKEAHPSSAQMVDQLLLITLQPTRQIMDSNSKQVQ